MPHRALGESFPTNWRDKMNNKFIFWQTVYEKTTISAETEAEAWELFRSGNFQPEADGDEVVCEAQNRGETK